MVWFADPTNLSGCAKPFTARTNETANFMTTQSRLRCRLGRFCVGSANGPYRLINFGGYGFISVKMATDDSSVSASPPHVGDPVLLHSQLRGTTFRCDSQMAHKEQ